MESPCPQGIAPQSNHLAADLVVVGGGLAGVCAAISAARLGSTVILVQDRPVLGGNASSEVRMHVMGADCGGQRPGARESGLIEEFRLEDAVRNSQRSFSQWDLLLYEKVVTEPRITLLLNARCVACKIERNGAVQMIRSIRVEQPSTEKTFEISARYFADCSGDGRLGAEAGADFRMGREARSEFGESLAREKADTQTLGSSILFTARKHDHPQPYQAPEWARHFNADQFRLRPITGYDYGYWWSEWGGQLDVIRDNEAIRHELLRIATGVWDYVKNSGQHPDSSHWALDWIGAIPGKRESRRFLGSHVLTEADLMSGRVFEDQVAYGGWWIDLHPPLGIDSPEEHPCVHHRLPHLYSIPLRALHSRNVGNLFFAGRNISATHVAFASTRVMATCAVMGQAVGTAAAILRGTGTITELSTPEAVRMIQQTLLNQDAYLLGLKRSGSDDLALQATIASGDCRKGAEPKQAINGITRAVKAEWGSWAVEQGNAWESVSLPGWIELTWPESIPISMITLTFCSGLQRLLTLSPSESVTAETVRGPQPETICNYRLLLDGKEIVSVRGNYQRRRQHRFPSNLVGKRLRLEALTTHGLPFARLFDISVR